MTLPYYKATSGAAAREDIRDMLRRFGCENVGFMENFEEQSLLLVFTHRGRKMQLKASGQGWAALYLKENPWNSRFRKSLKQYEIEVLHQGAVAVNSILRDWVKGQIMAIECGILSFDAAFMPFMLGRDGRPLFESLLERVQIEGPDSRGET